jgi:hypothetical protein
MHILRSAIVPCLLGLLAGCGSGDAPESEAAREPPAETVLDDMIEQKKEIPAAVEGAQQQHVDETRRAIEASEGGGAEPGR